MNSDFMHQKPVNKIAPSVTGSYHDNLFLTYFNVCDVLRCCKLAIFVTADQEIPRVIYQSGFSTLKQNYIHHQRLKLHGFL